MENKIVETKNLEVYFDCSDHIYSVIDKTIGMSVFECFKLSTISKRFCTSYNDRYDSKELIILNSLIKEYSLTQKENITNLLKEIFLNN